MIPRGAVVSGEEVQSVPEVGVGRAGLGRMGDGAGGGAVSFTRRAKAPCWLLQQGAELAPTTSRAKEPRRPPQRRRRQAGCCEAKDPRLLPQC